MGFDIDKLIILCFIYIFNINVNGCLMDVKLMIKYSLLMVVC